MPRKERTERNGDTATRATTADGSLLKRGEYPVLSTLFKNATETHRFCPIPVTQARHTARLSCCRGRGGLPEPRVVVGGGLLQST